LRLAVKIFVPNRGAANLLLLLIFAHCNMFYFQTLPDWLGTAGTAKAGLPNPMT
jgi:hypothetical protein